MLIRARKAAALAAAALVTTVTTVSVTEANAPPTRYMPLGGGLILDTKTQLQWEEPVSATLVTLAAGKSGCAKALYRVPTVGELLTLVDDSQVTPPVMDPTFTLPKGATTSKFWTATAAAGMVTGLAWQVDFASGEPSPAPVTGTALVRCVKSLP
jgi:hypothetical protein